MVLTNEKGRLAEGSPIPKVLLAETTEFRAIAFNLQASEVPR